MTDNEETMLSIALEDLAVARRTIKRYDEEFLRLREEHATAVFAVDELTRALRDMTVRAIGQELEK